MVLIEATVEILDRCSHDECTWKCLTRPLDDPFCFRGTQGPLITKGMYSNLVNMIKDANVVSATPIKAAFLGVLVAVTGGKAIESSAPSRKEHPNAAACIDVGLLRYPDITSPYYKIYCITIVVRGKQSAGGATLKNCVTCEYRWRDFKPRLEAVQDAVIKAYGSALQDAEALFNEITEYFNRLE